MKGSLFLALAFVALCFTESGGHAYGADPATTVVTVKSLCPNCGKKIVGRLKTLPGVSAAQMDVTQKTFTIQSNPNISPKSVWETVESNGELPIRLEGPGGTFTSKPKS